MFILSYFLKGGSKVFIFTLVFAFSSCDMFTESTFEKISSLSSIIEKNQDRIAGAFKQANKVAALPQEEQEALESALEDPLAAWIEMNQSENGDEKIDLYLAILNNESEDVIREKLEPLLSESELAEFDFGVKEIAKRSKSTGFNISKTNSTLDEDCKKFELTSIALLAGSIAYKYIKFGGWIARGIAIAALGGLATWTAHYWVNMVIKYQPYAGDYNDIDGHLLDRVSNYVTNEASVAGANRYIAGWLTVNLSFVTGTTQSITIIGAFALNLRLRAATSFSQFYASDLYGYAPLMPYVDPNGNRTNTCVALSDGSNSCEF